MLIFFNTLVLLGLDITINKGSIKDGKYSILHLKDKEPFKCISKKDPHNYLIKFLCHLPNNIFIPNFKQEQYDFLSIKIEKEQEKTYLSIVANTKFAYMYPLKYDLHNGFKKDKEDDKYNNWSFFFSNEENNLIFKKNKKIQGLDFDIPFKALRPFIGTLDEDKKPIVMQDNEEIKALLSVKKLFHNKEYSKSLYKISTALEQYPNSIFRKDFLLYSLRNYDGVGSEDISTLIVDVSLEWLKDNPSDSGIPEVLFYLGSAYSRLYKQSESIQVFRELIDNYKTDRFSFMAKLKLGDNLKSSKNINDSIKLYEEVLYATKDINIALLASERIASKSLDDGVIRRAKHHYEEIIKSNIDFLLKDIDEAHALAIRLINNKALPLGLKILVRILETMDKRILADQHAYILFEVAGYYRNVDTDKAIVYYQQYLELYPKGLSNLAAREELDKLIFHSNKNKGLSDDEILENIEYLLKTYPGQPIAFRAFYKKMKIYDKRKLYVDILSQEEEVFALPKEVAPDKIEFLNNVKTKYSLSLLQRNQCSIFVKVLFKYDLQMDHKLDKEVFQCLFEQFRYKKARIIVERRLSDQKELDQKLWTYRLIQLLIKNLDYENTISAINDLLFMVKKDKANVLIYNETLYDLFFAYIFVNNEDKVIETGVLINKTFHQESRNIKVFKKIVQLAEKRLDTPMILIYGNKIKKLAKIYDLYLESPWVDYAIFKGYMNLLDLPNALKTLDNLYEIRDKVPKISISRIKYMQSTVYRHMNKFNQEKIFLQDCAELNNEKVWPNVCKNTLKWME